MNEKESWHRHKKSHHYTYIHNTHKHTLIKKIHSYMKKRARESSFSRSRDLKREREHNIWMDYICCCSVAAFLMSTACLINLCARLFSYYVLSI